MMWWVLVQSYIVKPSPLSNSIIFSLPQMKLCIHKQEFSISCALTFHCSASTFWVHFCLSWTFYTIENSQHGVFSVQLLSLSMSSMIICAIKCIRTVFLFIAIHYSNAWTHHILFLVEGHLVCSHMPSFAQQSHLYRLSKVEL